MLDPLSLPLSRPRSFAPALLGFALLALATPAMATDHLVTCPRPAIGQYATMVFNIDQLDIPSGEG
jgi:hypothetical protein